LSLCLLLEAPHSPAANLIHSIRICQHAAVSPSVIHLHFAIRLYLDAMALPRRFGKPDLFITMTANPSWPEITEAVPAGSHWKHHPDIIARVFYLKLNAMMEMIVSKSLFGKVLAHCHRIEWQVRWYDEFCLTSAPLTAMFRPEAYHMLTFS
jgi:hypothetical protein